MSTSKYNRSPQKAKYPCRDSYKIDYDFLKGEGPSGQEVRRFPLTCALCLRVFPLLQWIGIKLTLQGFQAHFRIIIVQHYHDPLEQKAFRPGWKTMKNVGRAQEDERKKAEALRVM